MEIAFQRPEAFWLLLLLPAFVGIRILWQRRTFAGVATVHLMPSALRASSLRYAPLAVLVAGFGPLVCALADPVVPVREQRVTSRGLDIALVLDLSSSMEEVMGSDAAIGARRTRLAVTKGAIVDFIGRRPDDRIGLVVFSDNSYVVSPLTIDHDYLRRYVAAIDEQTLRSEGMTAIGEGVLTANMLLRRQAADERQRNGVLVIFTDGEHNHGRDPVEAVRAAFDAGYRVHLIGVDLDEEVKQKPAVLRLVRAVEGGGGHYFTADSDRALARVSASVDRLERGVLVSVSSERNAPAYEPFAVAAILLVSLAAALSAIPFHIDLT